MKIAIPTSNGLLCSHFGHCEEFTFISVDTDSKEIKEEIRIPAPEHEPGLLPRWIHEKGADMVIAGGMGSRAQGLFIQNGVKVVVGAQIASPSEIVKAYLGGSLETGDNCCDH